MRCDTRAHRVSAVDVRAPPEQQPRAVRAAVPARKVCRGRPLVIRYPGLRPGVQESSGAKRPAGEAREVQGGAGLLRSRCGWVREAVSASASSVMAVTSKTLAFWSKGN